MQDFNPSNLCGNVTSGSLTDRRDNQIYTVAKINGNWWMTRNLAIGCNGSGSNYGSSINSKQLTSAYSNASSSWSTPTTSLSSGDSYTDPRMTCSSTYGAWYNYAAATAGTIASSSSTADATKDICPAGWRLPSGGADSEQSSLISYKNIFNPIDGGLYYSSIIGNANTGNYWSVTPNNSTQRYALRYRSDLDTLYYYSDPRSVGMYIRCIRSS